jgi:uncharacterized protein (TIGR03435 family)
MLKASFFVAIFAAIAISSAMVRAGVQQSPQTPSFEAASVKPNVSGPGPFRNVMWPPGGRMTATGLTLRELIRSAYVGDGIQLISQIVGGPSWLDTDRFDIVAKMSGVTDGTSDDANRQRSAMLQTLLADRFGLKVHADTRPLPVFDLVLANKDGKLGPALTVSTCDREAAPAATAVPAADGRRPCVLSRMVAMNQATGVITMAYEGRTMAAFAAALVSFPEIDRPIRDRTGLTGAYDLQLTTAVPLPQAQGIAGAAPNPAVNGDSGILTALPEQLGLKLEARRDQADVIVVDSAERPVAD